MNELSDRVSKLSMVYLGPAAPVFLERQTRFHMNGLAFSALQKEHLPELAHWVLISASLLIDKGKAKELSDKILVL
jgi:hypothetical protein